ncbi:ThiF family adenylyltransferase [Paenibacillus sp. GP183]|uniref:ThiF family adenylyltransferase n=1 Tax=Paenibacillus sp. GP183 TaxID=1882751 RepID=UPI000897B0A6|nr:ThiF family adenylyltransferase [Paenibacillus sp. GP183]SEB45939.1 ThiF family protein [Paenibacillus sp. GP183]
MIKEQFIRNLGIMSEDEIQQLNRTTIAIAGCGCIGGFSAELLARMGVGKFKLADPDVFDVSNINRQCAATHRTVGIHKIEALKEHLLSINPEIEFTLFPDGVNEKNATAFVQDANYVIDAIDYFSFSDSVALHRSARKQSKFVITAVALGFGTSVLTFSPQGMSLEQYLGIPENMTLDNLKDFTFPPSGYTTNLPSYVTQTDLERWLSDRTIPTISVGQALGPGVLVSHLVLHLLKRRQPVLVPETFQLQLEV